MFLATGVGTAETIDLGGNEADIADSFWAMSLMVLGMFLTVVMSCLLVCIWILFATEVGAVLS